MSIPDGFEEKRETPKTSVRVLFVLLAIMLVAAGIFWYMRQRQSVVQGTHLPLTPEQIQKQLESLSKSNVPPMTSAEVQKRLQSLATSSQRVATSTPEQIQQKLKGLQ